MSHASFAHGAKCGCQVARQGGRARALLSLLTGLLLAGAVATGGYADDDEFGIMRVFVPADQLSGLLSRDYEAVPISELENLLGRRDRQRRARLLEVPQLAEAVYVARLEQGTLTSDLSRWVFSGNSGSRSFQLGEVSVALRAPRGATLKSDPLQFTSGGDLVIPLSGGTTQRLFGFSAVAADYPRPTFQIKLPVATSATMLISAPSGVQLSSPEVVVQEISDLAQELPEDWPANSTALTTALDQQWWKVYLSGVESFELHTNVGLSPDAGWYKHLLASSQLEYTLKEEWIDVAAAFDVVHFDTTSDLRLRVSKDLRISTLTIGGIQADWQVKASLSGETNLLEIANPDLGTEGMLELTAVCPKADEAAGPMILPQVSVAEAFALRGTARIRASQGIAIGEVQCDQARLTATFEEPSSSSAAREWSGIYWDATWFGTEPEIAVQTSRPVDRWRAESITNFSVNPDWLAATCHLRLSSKQLHSNELAIPVGSGWFVDRVRLVTAESDDDVTVRFTEEGSEQQPTTQVLLNWNQQQELDIELEVVAHRPLGGKNTRVRLLSHNLLRVPQAEQIDNYVLEPSGRYRVVVSADVLPYQRQAGDLPKWQQRYLPQLTDKWIFQGVRGTVPAVDLITSRPTFSSSVFVVLRESPSRHVLDYALRVQPISGLVGEVTVEFPKYVDLEQLEWELSGLTEANAGPVTWQAIPDPNYSLVRVQLPEPRESAFALTCQLVPQVAERDADAQDSAPRGRWRMALPVVQDALNSETTWVGPKRLSYESERADLDVLPTANCCEDASLAALLPDNSQDYLNGMLAARLDSKRATSVWFDEQPTQGATAWIWKEQVEHWIDGQVRRTHLVQWQVEVADDSLFRFELPRDWQLDSASINGVRHQSLDKFSSQNVTLELPRHAESIVRLRCSSHNAHGTWLTKEVHKKPVVDLPIASSTAMLRVPPHRVPLLLGGQGSQDARLIDRLNPSNWWHWLSPALQDPWTAAQDDHGWSTVVFAPQTDGATQTIVIVDRGALASLLLAVTIALTATCFILIGRSVRTGWLLLGALVVLLILVPSPLVGVAQLLMLSAVLAAILRLGHLVSATADSNDRDSKSKRAQAASSLLRVPVFVACTGGALWGVSQTAAAQGPSGDPSTPAVDTVNPRGIYGVLIPVEQEEQAYQVDGSYAYVRSELYDWLLNDMQTTSRNDTVRVLSASYLLRVNGMANSGADSVQELSAIFRVYASGSNAVLRLPISAAELPVSRLELNGQSVPVSESLVRQENSATIIRQLPSGNSEIKLFFRPEVAEEANGRWRMLAQVPAIPSSTLRAITSSTLDLQVHSLGKQERSGNELNVALGPVAELDCSWIVREADPDLQAAQATTHLWVHGSGNQVAAAAMLKVDAALTLPERFHIIVDSGWEPVGKIWGDAELLATQDSVLSNRKKYELRLRDLTQATLDSARIQVMLVPSKSRSGASLPLPFLYLQEANQSNERTVTWSAESNATWVPEGLNGWPVLANAASQDWGQFRLAEEARTYRVPLGFLATNLVRVPALTPVPVDESTELSISSAVVSLDYQANWKQAVPGRSALQFQIPAGAQALRVSVDGEVWQHRVLRDVTGQSMLAFAPQPLTEMQAVRVQLTYPSRINQGPSLQRVILQDVEVDSSIVRVSRSMGLEVSLEPSEAGVAIEAASAAQETRRSENLLRDVGQFNVRNEFRQGSRLPVEAQVTHSLPLADVRSAIYVRRNGDQWRAQLIAEWDLAERGSDYLFFEIPTLLKNELQSSSGALQFFTLGDSTRLAVAVEPLLTEAGKQRIELQYPLVANNSTQALSLPSIYLLSSETSDPVVALPRMVGEQEVVWSTSGQPLAEDWRDTIAPASQSDFDYFALDSSRLALTWETQRQQSEMAHVRACRVNLESTDGGSATGVIDYWIDPRGTTDLEFELPRDLKLIGCLVGDRTASTRQLSQDDRHVAVLLQPNYAAVVLRLLVRWPLGAERTVLALPRVKADWQAAETWAETSEGKWQFPDGWYQGRSPEVLAEVWQAQLEASKSLIASLEQAEKEAWLQGWHPLNVGIASDASLRSLDAGASESDSGREFQEVREYWDVYCANLAVEGTTVRPSRSFNIYQADRDERGALLLRAVDNDEIVLEPRVVQVSAYPKLLAAGLLASAVLLTIFLGRQLGVRYLSLLSRHPWVYWLQLAGILWLFLPVDWPAAVVALAAVCMAASQFLDFRRVTHFR